MAISGTPRAQTTDLACRVRPLSRVRVQIARGFVEFGRCDGVAEAKVWGEGALGD
jgi:hypothetical protein